MARHGTARRDKPQDLPDLVKMRSADNTSSLSIVMHGWLQWHVDVFSATHDDCICYYGNPNRANQVVADDAGRIGPAAHIAYFLHAMHLHQSRLLNEGEKTFSVRCCASGKRTLLGDPRQCNPHGSVNGLEPHRAWGRGRHISPLANWGISRPCPPSTLPTTSQSFP